MKRPMALAAASALFACASAPADDEPALSWLSGCWASASGATQEIWSPRYGAAAAPLLFGYSVTVRDGAVGFFEQMRIEPVMTDDPAGPGRFAYVVSPGGAPAVRFTGELAADGMSVSFENAAHDFPQRIVYAHEDGELRATISLIDGSEPRGFAMSRCEG